MRLGKDPVQTITQVETAQLNEVEHVNVIRLTIAMFGFGNHPPLNIMLGKALKSRCTKNINHIAGLRLTSRKSNLKYHMVQEEVEHHDLMLNIRNMARVSITSRAAGDIEKANEYHDASLELRDRAAAQIDTVISKTMLEYSGARAQVLRSRLQVIRAKVMVDPFAAVAEAMDKEEPYYRLDPTQKSKFWLGRYDDLVLAWYWDFRGIMDIQATLASEPMKTYSKEEFVFACNALWDIVVAADVERRFLAQSGSVAERMLGMYATRLVDEDRYRNKVRGFNILYNSKHPQGRVDDLSVVRVPKNSFNSANGHNVKIVQHYITLVEDEVLNEMDLNEVF